jgi:hypothetical protein
LNMAQAVNNEITSAWRALSGGDIRDGWRSIFISGLNGNRLMASRNFPSNDEALLVGFIGVDIGASLQLPHGTGFRVEQVKLDTPELWLALVRQPQGSLDLFTLMVTDIVAMLTDNVNQKDERLFQLFLGRIRSWQQFMKKNSEGLNAEEELGLYGELECLDFLIDCGLPSYTLLEGWVGPLDGLQDFELGHGAIEVKSTLASEGFVAKILSLEQLNDSYRNPLFLCALRFTSDLEGWSLPQRVAAIREKIKPDTSALAVFENAMLHAGFRDMDADLYARRFRLIDSYFHLVNEKFPRLIPGNIPFGIRQARYEIEINANLGDTFPIMDVIKMIGMSQHGNA